MIKQIRDDLTRIYKEKPKRLKHVYGVVDMALKLGKEYNCDLEKLEIAALLHDITKYYSYQQNKDIIEKNYQNATEILTEHNEHILHAYSARIIARDKYHVTDTDILDSITHHTIGKPDMSLYEKIIFISDYTEDNRTYLSCVETRELLKESLDKAVYKAIDDSIKFYEKTNGDIPKTAYQARTYYKQLLEDNYDKN